MKALEREATDRSGTHVYELRLIHEFGRVSNNYADKRKISEKLRDLWKESSKHDVLFSDFTKGDPEPFIVQFFDARTVWFEITRKDDPEPVGAIKLDYVIPRHDALVHLTLWDSIASGREEFLKDCARFIMDRYGLVRLTAEIPVYQKGVARLMKRLGFELEGTRRKAVKHKGAWLPNDIYGLLDEDLEERNAIRSEGILGNTDGDSGSDGRRGASIPEPVRG